MSQGNYEGISIREAMERINNIANGWFLPQIQRQYVWGNRDSSEEYAKMVDVLWNMQPTPAELNNYKRMKHPVDFFASPEGRPFLVSYDFLPPLDSEEFKDASAFIEYRRAKMLEYMRNQYGIVVENTEGTVPED